VALEARIASATKVTQHSVAHNVISSRISAVLCYFSDGHRPQHLATYCKSVLGRDRTVVIATALRAGRSGDRIPVGARFSAHVQNVPGAYPASYTECNRRNGPDFGRVFLMLNYTEKPQNTYIQS